MSKKQLTVTIEGAAMSGKTALAQAFRAFLYTVGIEADLNLRETTSTRVPLSVLADTKVTINEKRSAPKPPPANNFEEELRTLVNRYNMESRSNTPDYVLAQFLTSCLNSYTWAVEARERHSKQGR